MASARKRGVEKTQTEQVLQPRRPQFGGVLTVYAADSRGLRRQPSASPTTRGGGHHAGIEHEPPSRPAFEPSRPHRGWLSATAPRPAAAKGHGRRGADRRPSTAEATDKAGTKASVSRRSGARCLRGCASPRRLVAAPPVVETAPAVTPSAVSEAAPAAASRAAPSAPPSAPSGRQLHQGARPPRRHQATVVVPRTHPLATITRAHALLVLVDRALPRSRQSPESDRLRVGATQSTNAFYYAVVDVSKAK